MRDIYVIDEMKLDIVPFLDAGKQFLMSQTWVLFSGLQRVTCSEKRTGFLVGCNLQAGDEEDSDKSRVNKQFETKNKQKKCYFLGPVTHLDQAFGFRRA